MENYKYKQVIVVRKDLNMRKGKIASQVAHASTQSITKYLRDINEGSILLIPKEHPMWYWTKESYTKIVVSCKDEKELLEIMEKAKEVKVDTTLITDLGFTEFHGIPTNTCLAVGPDTVEKVDLLVKNYPLL
jgi:peptidyl-tRNA hydrolase, PTH2 family